MSDQAPPPAPGAPPPPPPPADDKKPGLPRRAWSTFWGWPTSAQITTGVLLIMFLVAAAAAGGTDDQGTEEVVAAESAEEALEEEATTTTEQRTTTTRRETTTTTTEPPTTTTTISPEEMRSLAVLAMQTVFEENRATLAETLNGLTDVETVDRLVFENETVVVDVTSGWASPDNQHDGAWTIMKAMAQFWEPNEGVWWQEEFVPNLQFVNSGRVYNCSGDFVVQMATLSAGREQWEAQCA